MAPYIIFFAIAGLIRWAAGPKDTGIGPATTSGYFIDSKVPEGFAGPPLLPEEESLLCLLTLWARDKKYPVSQKRYFNKALAKETIARAMKLGLRGTARAVLTDGPIPEHELMGRRGVTVRQAIVNYNRSKRS